MRGGVSVFDCKDVIGLESSPRAWGCFLQTLYGPISSAVFPTCVGVFLRSVQLLFGSQGLPHVRGGVSLNPMQLVRTGPSSPRAWGCFFNRMQVFLSILVFPTCVGVFLGTEFAEIGIFGLPHVRGGVSKISFFLRSIAESSPRAWGCFYPSGEYDTSEYVFPTCVGVFPYWNHATFFSAKSSPRAWGCFRHFSSSGAVTSVFPTCVGVFLIGDVVRLMKSGLPHVRGGVSSAAPYGLAAYMSSPRAWGCFWSHVPLCYSWQVFPTCVGVFLSSVLTLGIRYCLPHVRGGVSDVCDDFRFALMSSPRAWGCFHRRDGVENAAAGLPHVRGGVSLIHSIMDECDRSSPRAWGCFCTGTHPYAFGAVFPTCVGVFLSIVPPVFLVGVFPTCVGVFLSLILSTWFTKSLPHVRGGVSERVDRDNQVNASSPRAWGCFLCGWCFRNGRYVFPTCVGVFLSAWTVTIRSTRLPHVRGGVSFAGGASGTAATSSPRAWGCFWLALHLLRPPDVFPTCVGVFPRLETARRLGIGLPHVRGGVSEEAWELLMAGASSPRAWGCFHDRFPRARGGLVFPTCVGVFPGWRRRTLRHSSSSPRAWGCF